MVYENGVVNSNLAEIANFFNDFFLKITDNSVHDWTTYSPVMLQMPMHEALSRGNEVYMPTNDHEDDEVEEVYGRIEEIIKEEGQGCNKIVMGDWNVNDENEQVLVELMKEVGDLLNFIEIER
ncbi:hypothetical protein J437_LFUL011241 [Ladona fulva]|uniref:Uncharacterized protein n=1 Tax=Ladona fulva TaxID=123851 RepID=A0A8K0KCC5_LADFU|nr:hypothetical protein J437_LFUL011241 [Ladona fulva]